ncbi:hypothetical protein ACT3TI_09735 [Psychrobacter sp. AOP22-C1-22]|uniref:hypothetical protein n=1 Tax=unclassified Psychrobacter TaxID=196806 RepID=UPI001787F73B|nr:MULTISPECIES: hypothetical protein [unclassified Psychrobacter]MDN5891468.1 hypothetical protein [Psychrobacter sp.]MBE0407110.1 hypothetical protein [Psychrobacter sp. FME6]MBE0445971.1 hypothetical protein [Psychrobacter sp. FME5]MCG3808969.1 hypothetical protein [Psychrobacter sp. Ps4]MDN5898038.1 hypothetical protein [Psychrobacter sp.]
MRKYIFILASFLLIACQPEAHNNSNDTPNSSLEVDMDSKIMSDDEEAGDNVKMAPITEQDDYVESDFDTMKGLINKKGKCLYIDDYLILIQTESLSFNEDISALYDEENQVSFGIGDTVTLGGFSIDYSDLMDNDMGSSTEWKNPYLYDCQADKVWITVDIVY